jgi:hypothetical protein
MSDAVVAHEEYVKGALHRGRCDRLHVLQAGLAETGLSLRRVSAAHRRALIGIGVTLFFPGLTRRIGKGLSEAEGLHADT